MVDRGGYLDYLVFSQRRDNPFSHRPSERAFYTRRGIADRKHSFADFQIIEGTDARYRLTRIESVPELFSGFSADDDAQIDIGMSFYKSGLVGRLPASFGRVIYFVSKLVLNRDCMTGDIS